MSRYANARGVVSIAIPFICQITGLGSKNTVEHHIRLMESMGVLEKRPGKGSNDRKSNTYIFLGEQRNWKPLPTERPGTDPWRYRGAPAALFRSKRGTYSTSVSPPLAAGEG